jgi:hypothetical protein
LLGIGGSDADGKREAKRKRDGHPGGWLGKH